MACLMLSLWLGLIALVSSPLLHAKFHSDSQSPDHVCLVTQLQHQHLLAGTTPVLIPVAPLQQIEISQIAQDQFVFSFASLLSPGRGPPSPALIGMVVG
jgi:hypothetical protein